MNRIKAKNLVLVLIVLLIVAGYILRKNRQVNSDNPSSESFANNVEVNKSEGGVVLTSPLASGDEEKTSSEAVQASQNTSSGASANEPALSEAEKQHQDYAKEPPRFEAMSDSALQDFLKMYSLGSGADFLPNVNNFTQPLQESPRGKDFERLLSKELLGKFRSRFLTIGPQAESPDYNIEVHFKPESIEVRLVKDNATYYQAEITKPREEVRTSSSSNLPANLLLKFPAKLEYGYRHPLYLQFFVSYSREQLVGSLYLTNQSEEKPLYFPSEEMAFDKVSF